MAVKLEEGLDQHQHQHQLDPGTDLLEVWRHEPWLPQEIGQGRPVCVLPSDEVRIGRGIAVALHKVDKTRAAPPVGDQLRQDPNLGLPHRCD